MKHAVENGREQYTRGAYKNESGKQRISGGEEFGCIRGQGVHRPHTCEDHGRIQDRIYPVEFRDEMIAKDAERQRKGDETTREGRGQQEPLVKRASPTERRLGERFANSL